MLNKKMVCSGRFYKARERSNFMNFRKIDYIVFYVVTAIIFIINLMSPVKVGSIFAIFIVAVFPALILGTITNFIFKR
jgi:hypothetical protein